MLKNFLNSTKQFAKELVMTEKIFIIAVLIGVMSLITSVTYYNYQRDQAMKSNIESAIVKGIDPIAVRCAYADRGDTICVSYAATANLKK